MSQHDKLIPLTSFLFQEEMTLAFGDCMMNSIASLPTGGCPSPLRRRARKLAGGVGFSAGGELRLILMARQPCEFNKH